MVIPFNLFLDIVPSSSKNVGRAMRRQPKRLPRNYPRRNGGKCGLIFHIFVCTFGRVDERLDAVRGKNDYRQMYGK